MDMESVERNRGEKTNNGEPYGGIMEDEENYGEYRESYGEKINQTETLNPLKQHDKRR